MKTPSPIPKEYDLLILGSGAAGKLISWTLARQGMKSAVVERKYISGSCPNIACLVGRESRCLGFCEPKPFQKLAGS